MMGIPIGTFCSKIEFKEDGKTVEVTREVDFGLQKIKCSLPAIFTCDLRLNTPRFANVQNIIKAKKKDVETINLSDLGINVDPRIKIESVENPKEREGGIKVESVDELILKLRTEAKVI